MGTYVVVTNHGGMFRGDRVEISDPDDPRIKAGVVYFVDEAQEELPAESTPSSSAPSSDVSTPSSNSEPTEVWTTDPVNTGSGEVETRGSAGSTTSTSGGSTGGSTDSSGSTGSSGSSGAS